MAMLTIKIYHGFNLSVLALYVWLIAHNEPSSVAPYLALWMVYLFVFLGLLQGGKWCFRLSLLPPLVVALLTTPFVLLNLWAFVSGDPHYLDSPATIIVVGISACFTTLPAIVVLREYWGQRSMLFALKDAKRSEAECF